MKSITLYILSLHILFPIIATSIRLAIGALFESYYGGLIVTQMIGCFIKGVVQVKTESRPNPRIWRILEGAFCGSLTTFSSFQLQIFSAYTAGSSLPRQKVLDASTICLFTLFSCFAALTFGQVVTRNLQERFHRSHPRNLVDPAVVIDSLLGRTSETPWEVSIDYIVMTIAIIVYTILIVAVFLSGQKYQSWRHISYALLMAPIGAGLRYYLSKHWNWKQDVIPSDVRILPFRLTHPWGTFTANILGCITLSLCYIGQRLQVTPPDRCSQLQGLEDGLAACLSTLSTWIAEMQEMPFMQAIVYGGGSMALGHSIVLLIVGTGLWTGSLGARCDFV